MYSNILMTITLDGNH